MPAPFVLSSDLVSAYPAKSVELANFINGYKLDTGPVQNAQTGTTYTFALSDTTKTVTANNAAASAYTIPPQSSVVWEAYTVLRLVNLGAGVVTLTPGAGVTLAGLVAVPQYGSVSLMRTASNTWSISGICPPPSSGTATVATSQSTTSTSYTDLATVGPSVTLTTGTKALVIITAEVRPTINDFAYASVAVSGATTVAASDTWANYYAASQTLYARASSSHIFTGLTAGSNVFTMKFRAFSANAATFINREIIVIDLGS